MIAANFDTCHVYYGRRAAGLYCHRSSRGTLILALWVWRAPCRGVWREIVKAVEAYELTTQGGATDFARLIAAFGPYCPIGGLAVNCFVEPVYTLDADIVATRPPTRGPSVETGLDTERTSACATAIRELWIIRWW
jgi:hypothetical protein